MESDPLSQDWRAAPGVPAVIGRIGRTVAETVPGPAGRLARLLVAPLNRSENQWREIAPGAGRVVQWHGAPVAAYREPSGRLHTVSARCTHRGCLVEFNDEESTWDCPCHGARFAVDGAVVLGRGLTTEALPGVAVTE